MREKVVTEEGKERKGERGKEVREGKERGEGNGEGREGDVIWELRIWGGKQRGKGNGRERERRLQGKENRRRGG